MAGHECNTAGQAMPGSESDEDIDEAALLEALEEADSDDDDVRAPGSRQGVVHARRCLETMGDDLVLRIMGLLRCPLSALRRRTSATNSQHARDDAHVCPA